MDEEWEKEEEEEEEKEQQREAGREVRMIEGGGDEEIIPVRPYLGVGEYRKATSTSTPTATSKLGEPRGRNWGTAGRMPGEPPRAMATARPFKHS
eukprot:9473742-Pyramimonas_sp.AAC.1